MRKILKIAGGYGYYDEITFLKGFSIMTTVLMHYLQNGSFPGLINTAFSIGGTGVHIFFFCSGFGLYISYMEKPLGYTEFIKNRLLKIYIPYIIIVGLKKGNEIKVDKLVLAIISVLGIGVAGPTKICLFVGNRICE